MGTMEVPSQQHLQRRGKVWYFRRRVPQDLISAVGRETVFESLKTVDLNEAKQRRNVRLCQLDAEWAALREQQLKFVNGGAKTGHLAA